MANRENIPANEGGAAASLPGDYRLRRAVLRGRAVVALTGLTMVLLTVIQEPIGWSALAWLALAPWVLAVVGAKSGGMMAGTSYVLGLAYYLVNLWWLAPVTAAGYGGLCFYLAWYFVLSGWILRRVYLRRRWPFTLVLPCVWVAQEYLRAVVLTGFPWLSLSHSQHESLRLIQVSDVLGAYGVTFLVAMVSGLGCDLLLRPLRPGQAEGRRPVLGPRALALLTAGCLVAATLYGKYRLSEGESTITAGATVAVIQEAIPQFVKQQPESAEEIFDRHLVLSEEALRAEVRPELIVWPETMAVRPLNREYLSIVPAPGSAQEDVDYLSASHIFDQQLRALAGQGVSLLVGAPSVELEDSGAVRQYNSAILYRAGGQRYPGRYDKMHLVPFGEVVPFRESIPWLYRLLMGFTPYDFEYTLEAGDEAVVFDLDRSDKESAGPARFAVAICYEDVTPSVPRQLTAAANGRKRADFLLNISNDGWFVRGGDGAPIEPTAELLQHWAICKFRAVENRVGIVRAVNTGISGFIMPTGAAQGAGLAGSLPADPRARQAVAGFLTDTVYFDSRVALYSRMGDVFAIACTVLAGLLLLGGPPNKLPSRW